MAARDTEMPTTHEGDRPRRALKRRGLIAGAAALATGLIVTQQQQSVGAYSYQGTYSVQGPGYGGQQDGNADGVQGYASGANNAGVFGRNDATGGVGIYGIGSNSVGVQGQSATGNGVAGVSSNNYGVYGYCSGGYDGVFGKSGSGKGVSGVSDTIVATYGQTKTGTAISGVATNNGTGVYGNVTGNGVGVVGISSGNTGVGGTASNGNSGVFGTSDTGYGVIGITGQSANPTKPAIYGVSPSNAIVANSTGSGYGIYGTSTSGIGIVGQVPAGSLAAAVGGYADKGVGVSGNSNTSAGVSGNSNNNYGVHGNSTSGIGVFGDTTSGYGVYGVSGQSFGVWGMTSGFGSSYGVYGTAATAHGVCGYTTGASYAAILGVTYTAGAYAGAFNGPVSVTGPLNVNGAFTVAGTKSAAVPFADGSHRLLYCMESPESWFEDFGTVKLVAGKADVIIDPDFATTILTDEYHVFLTPNGDSNGLYVASKTATGFAVREQKGGTTNLTFSYRIVAKRKDIKAERLAKFALGSVNIPTQANLPIAPPMLPSVPPLPVAPTIANIAPPPPAPFPVPPLPALIKDDGTPISPPPTATATPSSSPSATMTTIATPRATETPAGTAASATTSTGPAPAAVRTSAPTTTDATATPNPQTPRR